jgi:hypothetical protein
MIGVIVTVIVVLAIFVLVASLLAVYIWRVDPHQFALWRAAVRSKGEGRKGWAPRFGGRRIEVVSRPTPPVATVPSVPPSGKSAAARLEYWVDEGQP